MSLQAGDIVFDIKADDSDLQKAIVGVKASFSQMGTAVGATMTVAGAAITGFAAHSVMDFADLGDAINDMAMRTDFSTEALSELKFAAEQSGASIEGIEKASRKLSEVIVGAYEGNETYQQSLANLGFTWEELAGMTPEEQFLKVAYALADVENATLRSAWAGDVFGTKMGTQLLPMLNGGAAGLEAMREQARQLGIVFDKAGAEQADAFNDAMGELAGSLTSLKFSVAEALIPSLIELANWVRDGMITFRQWREENGPLADSIIKWTVAVGAIMTVLGPLLVMLPGLVAAFTILKTAIIAVGAVFGALAAAVSAPVAVIVAAVGAIALAGAMLYNYWENVKSFLIGIWQSIAAAFELIFAPLIYAWEKFKGMFLDAQLQAQFPQGGGGYQQGTLPSGPLNNSLPGAFAGGGGGGMVTINNMVIHTNDPRQASRDIAQNLAMQLNAAGVGV